MKDKNQIKIEKILRLPSWIKFPISKASEFEKIQTLIKKSNIHTICEEGRCPNRAECYAAGTATFLLGGSICSRACAFCQVNKGKPTPLNNFESIQVAEAVKILNLKYVVLTSVARDDLPDHGANLFISTINEIRKFDPKIQIEVLTPDLWGGGKSFEDKDKLQKERLRTILEKKPTCFNHNLETVERLQKEVRRGASYKNSLSLLEKAKSIAPDIQTKSGIMLGLGETLKEIETTILDLKKVNCDQITIGQYLRPSLKHLSVKKYWEPSEFEYLTNFSKKLGFKKVSCGPLVRSSYHAG
ncbi:Lipoate synthase [Prochlorococcus marinus str. MIT 9515]|uniref:Lipoyl synthase n=1 Tax=Prochlorococcus marinus (strain MIT 9515) TaxID=167542 RepID=A2BX83_PROM5|nr:lipoyl synthase [Prochlorococcus marinus]ABM72394.1 Lipoate synthase [Prochlorococcus marinus str. MIT 9515]